MQEGADKPMKSAEIFVKSNVGTPNNVNLCRDGNIEKYLANDENGNLIHKYDGGNGAEFADGRKINGVWLDGKKNSLYQTCFSDNNSTLYFSDSYKKGSLTTYNADGKTIKNNVLFQINDNNEIELIGGRWDGQSFGTV